MAKNLLRALKLNELSLVDRGANQGAKVTLFKRDVSKVLSEARTPSFEGTENTDWSSVELDLSNFVDGYFKFNPDAQRPEGEINTVDQLPAAAKSWIAGKTLIGESDAETVEDLIAFPVVNPNTNRLNRNALLAAKSRAPQANIPESTVESIQSKADSLLMEHYEKRFVEICKGLFDENPETDFNEALIEEARRQQAFEVQDKLFPLFDALRESVITSAIELSGEERENKIRENVQEFFDAINGTMNSLAKQAGFEEAGSPGATPTSKQGGPMDLKELEKKVGELEDQLAGITKERDALIEATGATVEKSDDGEVKVIEKREPEYVTVNGEKVAKSDVPEPVLKAIESQNEEIRKMRERQERDDLRKRAESELPNLSGNPDHKAELLKAIDGIEDEDVRKGVMESLKAADTSVSKLFAEVGKTVADDESSATYQLEKMSRDLAKEENITYEQAFAKCVNTPEGRQLRKQADAERRAQ